VCNDIWDLLGSNRLLDHLAQLVLAFGLLDTVRDETAFDIVKETEGLFGLIDADHICEGG
jgi:hypothetical protein